MLKRVLVFLSNDEAMESVLGYAKFLKEKYGTVIYGLYVKDIRKYEVFTPVAEGILIENSPKQIIAEWEKMEESTLESVKSKFAEYIGDTEVIVKEGITPEVVAELLHGFDLLMVSKLTRVSQDLKALLRMHYRPMLAVPLGAVPVLDKVVVAYDGGINANKSLFDFTKVFDEVKNIDILSVNVNEKESLTFDYLKAYGINAGYKELSGDVTSAITKESVNYDLMVMGDLKYFFMLEKITGKAGVNIFEKSTKPIFIG